MLLHPPITGDDKGLFSERIGLNNRSQTSIPVQGASMQFADGLISTKKKINNIFLSFSDDTFIILSSHRIPVMYLAATYDKWYYGLTVVRLRLNILYVENSNVK